MTTPRTRQSAQRSQRASTRSTTKATAPAPAERRTGNGAKGARTATLNLPFVTAQFRAPDIRLPQLPRVQLPRVDRDTVNAVAHTARTYLPSNRTLAYAGGVAALAVFDVIEWPVAAVIGVGSIIFQRGRGSQPESSEE